MKTGIIAFSLFLFLNIVSIHNAVSSNMYLLPKVSLNYPVSGGDITFAFGGGAGYWVSRSVAMETVYLRIVGSGDYPDVNILEIDSYLTIPSNTTSFFFQIGSGFYKVSDKVLDTGITPLIDTGIGIDIKSIPSTNLRIGCVYYYLQKHRDLLTGQASFVLNF